MKRVLLLVIVLILITTIMAYAENEIIKYDYETVIETALSNSVQPELTTIIYLVGERVGRRALGGQERLYRRYSQEVRKEPL